MANTGAPRGVLQIATPAAVAASTRAQDDAAWQASQPTPEDTALTSLAAFVRREFSHMRNHRGSAVGWNHRLIKAQQAFRREYDPVKLQQIKQMKGSEAYASITATKCRGASALLREIYLGPDRPWGLDPTPDPVLPDEVNGAIDQMVQAEVAMLQEQYGVQVEEPMIRDRVNALKIAAKQASKKRAKEQAKLAEDKLDDLLVEGGWYDAMTEFLQDLTMYPLAIIKGPVVRMVQDVVWQDGKAVTSMRAKMFWKRVSPFDFYFTPGVTRIEDAAICERTALTRADLNDVLGLPGYNEEAIRQVLREYGRGGLRDWLDATDQERANNESRESPMMNVSGLIDCLEYHGPVQGSMLLEHGFGPDKVPDPDRDYFVQVWLIGKYVIKTQFSPSPRKRHPYFTSSYEKIPGTIIGNALPDMLEDIQDAANAVFRSMLNNLSIASGPQVVVNDDRLAPGENGDELYPWKRWHVTSDPMGTAGNGAAQAPITFFQPESRAQENWGVFKELSNQADEVSALPKYITGSDRTGGAGRTASGLAMVMGNANKLIQTVCSNIDGDVVRESISGLYDLVMLTDRTGMFRGDEAIRVRGVEVAAQREQNRQRQIEFLQATANPLDAQIMGMDGRAKVLESVAQTIGLPDSCVPDEDVLKQRMAGPPQGGPQMPGQGSQPKPGGGAPAAAPTSSPIPAITQQGKPPGQPGAPVQHGGAIGAGS